MIWTYEDEYWPRGEQEFIDAYFDVWSKPRNSLLKKIIAKVGAWMAT